jgi:hypothetical protein
MNYNIENLSNLSELDRGAIGQDHLEQIFGMHRQRKYGMPYIRDVAKAHVELGTTMLDPKTYIQMVKDYKRGKGIIFPGSRYIGPFNPMPEGGITEEWMPTSRGDYSAYLHDRDYGRYLEEGKTPYTRFSEADQRMIDRAMKDLSSAESLATFYGMTGRKAILPKL